MPGKKVADTFANLAALDVVESAANTQTAVKFSFPFSIMDKMALVIQRIEYDFYNLPTVLAGANDRVVAGILCSGQITDVNDPTDPLMLDSIRIQRFDVTAVSVAFLNFPIVKDFTNLAGGGLLVAPNPLYGFVQGIGAAAAAGVTVRMFYTYMELATDEYWQLVESRRIIGA